ncbi:MAG: aminofutalosine synthase MqnE [Bacteroidales bacterium]
MIHNFLDTVIQTAHPNTQKIFDKIFSGTRISFDDCVLLYKFASLSSLGVAAEIMRTKKNDSRVFFNKNIHIEPTNICIHNCSFCSYSRKKNQAGSWELSIDEMVHDTKNRVNDSITEFHIVGGVHPDRSLSFYVDLLRRLKREFPTIHIKAFTAVEIDFMAKSSQLSFEQTLSELKSVGLDSMPGGGAEIFDESVRHSMCPSKTSSENWLAIHHTAHDLGIPTTATMLYGHVETYEQRVDHMMRVRDLQDKTNGFQAFIPLKYKKENNDLSVLQEGSWIEDLRNYAISRIFLDNFSHIKAYWPMIGKDLSQISLAFGVDDFDGTINDSTKIYSMAGAEDKNPSMSQDDMVELIKQVQKTPVERDSLYNIIHTF